MPGKLSKRDEHLWKKAKGVVSKQHPKVAEDSDRYWKLVQGVYQKMTGGKSMSEKIDMTKREDTMLDNYPLLKSRVKAHQRRTKTGKVVQVKEHQDSRQKKSDKKKIWAESKEGKPLTQMRTGFLVRQAELVGRQLMKNPKAEEYKVAIQRKIDDLKKNPSGKEAINVMQGFQNVAKHLHTAGKSMLEDYPHLEKSRVRAHQRRTKTGKVVQVKEHQDIRSKQEHPTGSRVHIHPDIKGNVPKGVHGTIVSHDPKWDSYKVKVNDRVREYNAETLKQAKRPGGKQAEEDYHHAYQQMKKYAGSDIPKAEKWAKKMKEAQGKMLPNNAKESKQVKKLAKRPLASLRKEQKGVYDRQAENHKEWKNAKGEKKAALEAEAKKMQKQADLLTSAIDLKEFGKSKG